MDDLYRPYRPKRRTRATIAKEKGLEPLAVLISLQNSKEPLEKEAEKYVSEEKGVKKCAGKRLTVRKIFLQKIFQMRQITERGSAI